MRTELKSHSNPDLFGQSANGSRCVDDEADSDLAGFSPRPDGLHAVRSLHRATLLEASNGPSLGVVMVPRVGGQTEINPGQLPKEEHPLGAPQEGHGSAALEEGHYDKPEEGYGRPAA